MIRHRPSTVAATLAALAGIGCLSLYAAPSPRADVPIDQVPQVVVEAATRAVEGIALSEAKMRTKKSGVVFKLAGAAREGRYQIKVDAAGNVLEVERDASGGRAGKSAKARREPLTAPGPVGETFADSPAVRVGFIRHPAVRESSGVAASRVNPGVFWTHNDKGNAPVVYAMARDGSPLAEYHVSATHDDWEDVAADAQGNLYVGNVGNNSAERQWLEVHRVREPRPAAGPGAHGTSRSLKAERTWRLKFPAAPFDCESLFVHGASGYVISKRADGAPAALYRFPLDGDDEVTLERVADLPTRAPVTAADLSPDGATLAVLAYGEVYTFAVNGDIAAAGRVEPRRVKVPAGKLEGLCITDEGIVITSEGRDVYSLPIQ